MNAKTLVQSGAMKWPGESIRNSSLKHRKYTTSRGGTSLLPAEKAPQVETGNPGHRLFEAFALFDFAAHLIRPRGGHWKVLGLPSTRTERRNLGCNFSPEAQRQAGLPHLRGKSSPLEICGNDVRERRRPILSRFRSIGKPGGYGLRNRCSPAPAQA